MALLSRVRFLLSWWSLWRLVLTGCLCVAIPLQGHAAVSKAWCPHHAAPIGGATGPSPDGHAQAHAQGAHGTPDADQGAAPHPSHALASPATSADCSQCGDCCPGLAPMPAQALPVTAQPPGQPAPAVACATAPCFLTSGPDRPPRRST